MINKLAGLFVVLSVLMLPASAETITVTCPDNNCTVTITGICNGTIDFSAGCALPMMRGIP